MLRRNPNKFGVSSIYHGTNVDAGSRKGMAFSKEVKTKKRKVWSKSLVTSLSSPPNDRKKSLKDLIKEDYKYLSYYSAFQ
jgi:hypothetical protein